MHQNELRSPFTVCVHMAIIRINRWLSREHIFFFISIFNIFLLHQISSERMCCALALCCLSRQLHRIALAIITTLFVAARNFGANQHNIQLGKISPSLLFDCTKQFSATENCTFFPSSFVASSSSSFRSLARFFFLLPNKPIPFLIASNLIIFKRRQLQPVCSAFLLHTVNLPSGMMSIIYPGAEPQRATMNGAKSAEREWERMCCKLRQCRHRTSTVCTADLRIAYIFLLCTW